MIRYNLVQKTKVYAKRGAVGQLGEILAEAGYRKPFLVFEKFLDEIGMIDPIREQLNIHKMMEAVEFSEVKPDPPSEIMDRGGQLCRESACDCVIAIGGGSSIDTAKGINILRLNGGSILDYAAGKEMCECPGLIAVPTTAGTGSELSDGLIVTDSANSIKVPVLADKAMSEYAVIDPALTDSMPEGITRATGLDVFSYAFEAYTSLFSSMGSDLICEKIMETVITWLPRAVKDGANREARDRMAVSASLGGWMLVNANSQVGHSIAHVLGAKYHLVHGEACAYGLPEVMKLTAHASPEKVAYTGRLLGAKITQEDTPELIGVKTAEAYQRFIYEELKLKPLSDEFKKSVDTELCAAEIADEIFAGLAPVKITKETAGKMLAGILQ